MLNLQYPIHVQLPNESKASGKTDDAAATMQTSCNSRGKEREERERGKVEPRRVERRQAEWTQRTFHLRLVPFAAVPCVSLCQ